MPQEVAGAPELTPLQRLDLRVTTDDGVHALRTQLQQVDPATGRLTVIWPTEQLRLFRIEPGQAVVVELSRLSDALYKLAPSGGAELRLRVNVVRIAPPRTAGHDAWEIGCQCVEPSAVEREQIVQFILAQQAAVAKRLA